MNRLKVQPIPVPKNAHHPEPPHPALPGHEFTLGLIAPKGSGKTTLMCNLLKFYKGYFHNIFVFSPTVLNDEKWKWVRKQPLLSQNTKLIKFIRKCKEEDEQGSKDNGVVVEGPHGPAPPPYDADEDAEQFDPHIPDECFKTEYSDVDVRRIIDEQQAMIEWLDAKGKTKHLANRILLIFDDMVGSELFGREQKNPFKRLNTNHRHSSISMMMVAQAYKEIQKTVRTNWTALIFFKIASDSELMAIYEDYPMGFEKSDDWLAMVRYVTQPKYAFLYYNMTREDERQRIMQNFDKFVFIGPSSASSSSPHGGSDDEVTPHRRQETGIQMHP